MTAARRRLWLGISAVGTIVVLAAFLLLSDLPIRWFPTNTTWSVLDGVALAGFVLAFQIVMIPFDLWSQWLSRQEGNQPELRNIAIVIRWLFTVGLQSTVFVACGLAILTAGRWGGMPAALAALLGLSIILVAVPGVSNVVADSADRLGICEGA